MKPLVCLTVTIFVLGLGLAGHGQKMTPAEKSTARTAEKLMNEGQYRKAMLGLQGGLRVKGNSAELNFLMAKCQLSMGHADKAKSHIEMVIQNYPEYNSEIDHLYAVILHRTMQFDEALRYYERAQQRYRPGNWRYKELEQSKRQCLNAKVLTGQPVNVRITNLGPLINTRFPEYCPVINADESVLFFASRRFSNIGSDEMDGLRLEDVYAIYKQPDGSWSKPSNLGPPINTDQNDATVTLSADGQTFILYREGDFYMSKLKGRKWGQPRRMDENICTPQVETSASFTPNGREIFFDRTNTLEGEDKNIFQAYLLPDGTWSEPKKLPEPINTPFDDGNPFMHPDGRTLFFSSRGHNSMGGYDLFKSVRQTDGSWSAPVNLGYPINTPEDDVWFVLSASGRHAYYSSKRDGGYGEEDLYMIDFFPDDTSKTTVGPALTLVKGQIRDAHSTGHLGATVILVDNQTGDTVAVTQSNTETGEYLVALPAGRDYGMSIRLPNYVFHSEHFDLPDTDGYHETVINVNLQPAKYAVGARIVLRNIFYDFDKATLRPTSRTDLDQLFRILKDYPQMRIRIQSHTDHKGSDEYNLKLSDERAHSVVEYLIQKGISAERLEYKGFGETDPVDTNDTETGRQNNRRTEFVILKI